MRKIYRPEISQDQDCEEEYWLRQLIRLVEYHTYTVDLIARSLAAKGNPHTPKELFHAMSQANTLDIRQLPRIGTGKDRNIPETDAAKQQRLLNHLCSLWDITALEKAEKDVMACACPVSYTHLITGLLLFQIFQGKSAEPPFHFLRMPKFFQS